VASKRNDYSIPRRGRERDGLRDSQEKQTSGQGGAIVISGILGWLVSLLVFPPAVRTEA